MSFQNAVGTGPVSFIDHMYNSCSSIWHPVPHAMSIPEEINRHGRKATNRSGCDSPRDSIPNRRSIQSETGGMSRLERARIAREKFEAERQRRLEQLQEARRLAEVFREQQVQLKRKRIEESKAKDVERRKSVEERRKRLEEIEKTRRENIQRKIERIDRSTDSRRSNTGPAGARIFGFGSCTPREICTPVRHAYSTLPVHSGSKITRDPSKASRTVITSPEVHWLSRQRDYSDWSHKGPRNVSAHATLMTGSFTVAMNSPLAIGLHPKNNTLTYMNPMKKAASITHLAKTGLRKPNRIVASEKDKLDRTVSTPNIASSNQRLKSRRGESGASSPTRTAERTRRSTSAGRPRPATALGHPRSETPPRRAISSLGVSSTSGNSSSGIFDRLSQPRRVQPRSEEVSPERKRNSVNTTFSSSSGSGKPIPKKTLKSAAGDDVDIVSSRPSVVTFQIEQKEAEKSDDKLSVEVNVEDVEADALNDIDSENTSENIPLVAKIEEEEVSDSLRNDTSAAATSLPTDRSASPPRTLQLSVDPVNTPEITASSSPLLPRPNIQRPNSVNAEAVISDIHPATSALPPPSPSAMMNKGSAPSTPTGQRASSTREMTEEEYKQRLAEQRRLARERKAAQEAEKARAREEERRAREAELQRLREAAEKQRMEEEEEQRRKEEEERKLEEERRRVEEQKRQEEEQRRQEEEKEREEMERKEREEMEQRQRQLEEERLAQQKMEEEKRLERKKRLESIMSRVKKSNDQSGSRESLTSSHLDLSPASNGSDIVEAERAVSPNPQFKSALLQSMLSKGKLSTSIRAVSAMRRSQGYNGSSGSLIGDLQNLSRSSENLSSTSNTGTTAPSSSSGEMSTSQIEDQLSPPPVVNPAMWRSHPNGIPGLGGHERDVDQSEGFEDVLMDNKPALDAESVHSRLGNFYSSGMPSLTQETRKSRPNSVHFDDVVSSSRTGTVSGDIVDDESASSDVETQLVTHNSVSGQWLTDESHHPGSMGSRSMADAMS